MDLLTTRVSSRPRPQRMPLHSSQVTQQQHTRSHSTAHKAKTRHQACIINLDCSLTTTPPPKFPPSLTVNVQSLHPALEKASGRQNPRVTPRIPISVLNPYCTVPYHAMHLSGQARYRVPPSQRRLCRARENARLKRKEKTPDRYNELNVACKDLWDFCAEVRCREVHGCSVCVDVRSW
jgi:hypothetical protein